MRKLFIAFFLLIPSLLYAGQGMMPGPGVKGATASCETLSLDLSAQTGDNFALAVGYGNPVWASSYVPSSSNDTICKAIASIKKTGTETATITFEIWSDKTSGCDSAWAHCPNALISSSTNTVNFSDLSTSYGEITFTGLSAALGGNDYHVVVHITAADNNGSNFISWDRGTYDASKYTFTKTSAGFTAFGNFQVNFKLYK